MLCLEGAVTLIQDKPDGRSEISLGKGEYAINPPGVWHTANVEREAVCLFITTGKGTEHRAR